MPKESSQQIMQRISIIVIFILCFSFLWWKSSYGYIFNDEPYIMTLGDRLVKGDLLLINEWKPTQLTGYLLYPFLRVYRLLHISTDGMILTFRHIYVLLWSTVIILCHRKMKQFAKSPWIAVTASLYLWLFSSLDQMNLSYNFFSLSGIMICVVLWMKPYGSTAFFLIGIFYSIAVLACPYLVVLYLIYVVVYSFKPIVRSELADHIFLKRSFLYINLGIFLSVCIFIANDGSLEPPNPARQSHCSGF